MSAFNLFGHVPTESQHSQSHMDKIGVDWQEKMDGPGLLSGLWQSVGLGKEAAWSSPWRKYNTSTLRHHHTLHDQTIQSVQCNEPWWGMLRYLALRQLLILDRKVSEMRRQVWISLELQSAPHSITRTLWPRQLPRWDRACLRGAFRMWIKAFCYRIRSR